MNLRHLPYLHVFALHAIISSDARKLVVLRDINLVLSTIPTANQVTELLLHFTICGVYPFHGCFEENWLGMCDEVVRISAGKSLELNLKVSISPTKLPYPSRGRDELYRRIEEKVASLLDYPNISTHLLHSCLET